MVFAMTDSSLLTIRHERDCAVIVLDDGKANALSFAMLDAINAALDQAQESAKAIAVIGRDGKFCAGFDLSVMTADPAGAVRLLNTGGELALRLLMMPIPVVFGVTGHALAMGGILTTIPDYRVGAAGAFKLGLNEVAIGMPVPSFAVELCRGRLAPAWFTRCVGSAHICSPSEAVDAGFLDEVVSPDSVASRAVDVAAHLALTVHAGPFATTRKNMRGELHRRLVDLIGSDEDFAVES